MLKSSKLREAVFLVKEDVPGVNNSGNPQQIIQRTLICFA